MRARLFEPLMWTLQRVCREWRSGALRGILRNTEEKKGLGIFVRGRVGEKVETNLSGRKKRFQLTSW